MTKDEMFLVLKVAVQELQAAVSELQRQTIPHTREVERFPTIYLPGNVHWPGGYPGKPNLYGLRTKVDERRSWDLNILEPQRTAEALGNRVGWQPRLVLRAVRRLQAAAAWCRARAAGRQRAAQEIIRQQSKAVEALEAEAVLAKLRMTSDTSRR
jgi:hypothetical protein